MTYMDVVDETRRAGWFFTVVGEEDGVVELDDNMVESLARMGSRPGVEHLDVVVDQDDLSSDEGSFLVLHAPDDVDEDVALAVARGINLAIIEAASKWAGGGGR